MFHFNVFISQKTITNYDNNETFTIKMHRQIITIIYHRNF